MTEEEFLFIMLETLARDMRTAEEHHKSIMEHYIGNVEKVTARLKEVRTGT